MQFTLFWLDGKREVIEGSGIQHAFWKAGVGQGATGAIDFWANGDCKKYTYVGGKWTNEKDAELKKQ